MGEKITNRNLRQLYWKCSGVLLIAFLFSFIGTSANAVADDELFESSVPVLISEANSTKALTANPDNWKGRLPGENPQTARRSEIFPPGSRVVVFVTNIGSYAG